MKKIKSLIRKNLHLGVLVLVTIGIMGLLAITLGEKMYNQRNFSSMAFQISEFAIISLGMGLVMLLGGIDLSIISNANLSGIMAAYVLTNENLIASIGEPLTVTFAVIVALGVATAAGAFNGVLITRFSVNPIVATLGTMILYQGISMALTGGQGITGFPKLYTEFGKATLFNVPYVFWVFIIIAFALIFVMGYSTFGKKIFMIGENHTAARFSSINNEKIVTITYSLAGLMAGFAALMIIARVNSAKVGYGDTYLLQAILVCVLAGISPSGGKGKVVGILLALLCLQILQSAFTLWQFTPYAKKLIWGIMLIGLLFINKTVDYMDINKQKKLLRQQRALDNDVNTGVKT